MKRIRKNWLVLPLAIVGFYYLLFSIRNADTEMIFDGFIYVFILLIFFIVLGFSFKKDYKANKIKQNWLNFIPSIFGIILLISFGVTELVLIMRDNSPVLLSANYNGDFNGAWFEFRSDGTYKFVNHAGVGAQYFRGNYTLEDSIITLDRKEIDGVIFTNKLAIRDKAFVDLKYKILYQIDENHKVVSKTFCFLVDKNHIIE